MACNGCGEEYPIVNKWFNLCRGCNNERLHGNKFGKQYDKPKKKNKPLRMSKNKPKKKGKSIFLEIIEENKPKVETKSMYERDNEFYKKCFETFNHRCEECGARQPENFLDSDGKVAARWRYSHIVPKSIAPEIRHEIENINDLCLKCHDKWEGEKKVEMKIYETNKLRKLLKKYFVKLW